MILLFSLLLATPAEASNKVGNGGNVVFCQKKGKAATVRLLDFYEHDISPSGEGTDPVEIARSKLEKLAPVAPAVAALYQRRLKEIMGEMELKAGVTLTPIDDSKHLFKPRERHCKVEQAAIRRASPTADEKLFLVRKDLWDKLAPAHKAGLLLHEIIHEHFSKLGEENSTKARKINSMVFSGKLERFWETIKDIRVPIYP
jgi:hypothetical protein